MRLRRAAPDPGRFTVLMVCTGNLCRSPMAQQMLRAALTRRLTRVDAGRVQVSSAGTAAASGLPMDPGAADALARRRIAPGATRSQPLRRDVAGRADLALTATHEHAREVNRLAGSRRALPLLQAGRLAAALDGGALPRTMPDRGRAAAALLLEAAHRDPPLEVDDLADPIGGRREDFDRCAEDIREALTPLVDLLAPAVFRP